MLHLFSSLTKLLILLYCITLCVSVDNSNTITDAEHSAVVAKHNWYRSQTALGLTPNQVAGANIQEMSGSDTLRAVAAGHAARCTFSHNANRDADAAAIDPTLGHLGENTANACSDDLTNLHNGGILETLMNLWYAEHSTPAGYSNGVFDSTQTADWGHYTQLMWHDTTTVGCGYSNCAHPSDASQTCLILVCNYHTAGNIQGQLPYQAGAACSACPASAPDCSSDSLCSGTAVSVSCTSDINGDQTVDINDLAIVLNLYGQSGSLSADLNGDMVVDINDLAIVLNSYGSSC